MELIMYQATKAGFSGGVVVDYPNSTKAKKYYLCLFAGVQATNDQMPTGNDFSANIGPKYFKLPQYKQYTNNRGISNNFKR